MNDGSHETNEARRPRRARAIIWTAGIAVVVAAVITAAVLIDRPAVGQPSSTESSTASTSETQTGDTKASDDSDVADVLPQLEPIAPDELAQVDDLEVQIKKVEHVTGEAAGPGEIAGPAIRVSIAITNDGKEPLDLDLVVVNGYYGASQTPANTFQRPGGNPFGGTLKAGKTAEGVLLFGVPKDEREDVTVTVDYRPGQPAVVFRGSY